ncbi:MAG: outer membrane beta-barrel protein [Fimbriimonadaceae bacterium]|nr:outer membrane beta-barrel protein [Alphaproteobacteria bacterium]
MTRFRTILLFVFCAFLPGIAAAADAVATGQSSQPKNWSGFHLGASIGYHTGDITQSGCVGSCLVNPKLDGVIATIEGGYDHQFTNNVVLGFIAILPLARPKETLVTAPFPFSFSVKPQFALVTAARLGYALDNFMPYVLAGYQFARVDVTSGPTTVSNNHHGAVFGVGLETALDENWSLDAKYVFVHSPKVTYNFGGGPSSYGENAHNLLFGVNYRF